jgi:hypothetical protein
MAIPATRMMQLWTGISKTASAFLAPMAAQAVNELPESDGRCNELELDGSLTRE